MPVPPEVEALSDHVSERTRRRLLDLTNDEFQWVPFADCWHAGADGLGGFRYDLQLPASGVQPFTTLEWRLFHLMGCYSGDRNAMLLGLEQGRDPLLQRAHTVSSATDALDLLGACQDLWRRFLHEVTDETLNTPLGERAGDYGEATGLDLVLHQIDEHIRHGAELGLLRDLYRVQQPIPG